MRTGQINDIIAAQTSDFFNVRETRSALITYVSHPVR